MATPGTYISGAGHSLLVVWLIAGWGFSAEPLPFEVSEVSVVSGDEYARIVAASTPQPGVAEPTAPAVPEVVDVAPAPPQDNPPPAPDPIPQQPPAPETPAVGAPDLAVSPRPQERQADRVAPDAVAPPPEDVPVSDIEAASAAPDQDIATEVVEDRAEESVQEETATTIVPEDIVPSGAVETSVRPSVRPNRPAPVTSAATTTASSDAVDAALAAATAPNVQQGPPMNFSEREGFRVAVNDCWGVDAGSLSARVKVVVRFSLSLEGRVVGNQVEFVSAEGDPNATRVAYDKARRAILQCQNRNRDGYDLPPEKYEQWRTVEITFDPRGMAQW